MFWFPKKGLHRESKLHMTRLIRVVAGIEEGPATFSTVQQASRLLKAQVLLILLISLIWADILRYNLEKLHITSQTKSKSCTCYYPLPDVCVSGQTLNFLPKR